ncbi:MAG: undecaprenyl-diphosphatase, partial [Gemmatimonadetes bacterium]|nr:undecaprenyl-diphosphatase [Gemmatimonadota bacterium]
MSVLEAIALGIIQGLTEFLPVSSSGHLVLGQALLGIRLPGVTFEVTVHLATLCAVLWV